MKLTRFLIKQKYPYEEQPHQMGGIHRLYTFKNGYGASVVRFKLPFSSGYGSYTSNENEWEVAVVRIERPDPKKEYQFSKSFEIAYDTPITDDVIGHVHDSELEALLDKIAALPKRKRQQTK